uniref:AbrB/MazE/SpoVT family DNA-binding domain-containing protein n=1 Tax=Enterocloster clostridioformis TaxID=1531 RepID=UPI0026EDF48B|nr:AbrB family transcriptional regulator [Enterocloster clostridioformis]
MNKSIYKLIDGKGRVLIPKSLRDATGMEYGDIVRLGISDGKVTIRKVDIVEAGDQSPEAVEAYVRAAVKSMPDSTRLKLIAELSSLLQKKEG